MSIEAFRWKNELVFIPAYVKFFCFYNTNLENLYVGLCQGVKIAWAVRPSWTMLKYYTRQLLLLGIHNRELERDTHLLAEKHTTLRKKIMKTWWAFHWPGGYEYTSNYEYILQIMNDELKKSTKVKLYKKIVSELLRSERNKIINHFHDH
jgi:hypothetical protein